MTVRRILFSSTLFMGAGLLVTACQRGGRKPIEDRTDERYDDREAEGGDGAGELFVTRGIEGIGDEAGQADSEKAGDEQVSGAEGADEIRFAQAEDDERDKLQQKA